MILSPFEHDDDKGLRQAPLSVLIKLLQGVPASWLTMLLVLMIFSALTDGIGIMLLVPMLSLLDPKSSGNASISNLLEQWGFSVSIDALLAVFLALIILRSLLIFAQGHVQQLVQHRVADRLSARCYHGLLRSEWRWLSQKRVADHQAALMSHIGVAGTAVSQVIGLVSGLLMGTAYIITALWLSWQSTMLAVIIGLVAFLALSKMRQRALHIGNEIRTANRDIHRHVQHGLLATRLIKIFGKQDDAEGAFAHSLATLRARKMAHMRDNQILAALFQIGGAVLLICIVVIGLRYSNMTLPLLFPLILIIIRLSPILQNVQQAWHYWLHAVPAISSVQALIAETEINAEPANAFATPLALRHGIALQNITVEYPDRDVAALDNVSLTIPARTTVAITGASGSGKSTLADLIMGLIMPSRGEVRIDDQPLTAENRLNWRRSVAYVEQDAFLFHDSIRANLLWANAGASDDELFAALKSASADFVLKLPQQLDTIVGDAGIRLSGGERQRITLARALLCNPEVLILDEATSALDSENEAAIRRAIQQLRGRMTVILISHRLSMLDDIDQMFEFIDGRVAGQ